MKRIILRTLLVVAFVVVCLVGTLSIIRGFSGSRLEQYKRELKAKGEKLRTADLITGQVVSNALIPRLIAANRQLGDAPSFHLMHSSGQPAWKRTNDWPKLHKLLDSAATPLAEIQDAVRMHPRDLGWDQTNLNGYPSSDHLIAVRTSSFWLSASVVIDLNRSNNQQAISNLVSMFDLVQCHAAERTLVYQMIRVGLAGFAFGASWELLQASGWNDDHLTQLQRSWQDVTLLAPIELTLQMERARGLEFFLLVRGAPSDDPSLNQPAASIGEAMYGPIWKVALSSGDELRFLRMMQDFLDGLRTAREKSNGTEFRKRLDAMPKRSWFADYRYPMQGFSCRMSRKR